MQNSTVNKRQSSQQFAGRAALGSLFLVSGLLKMGRFSGVAAYMASKGLPLADMLLIATIALEVGGGLALIVGWRTRWVAWALAAFTGLAAVIFHAAWAADAQSFQNQLNHLLKNVAIIGGLLYVAATGAGAWSLDQRRR